MCGVVAMYSGRRPIPADDLERATLRLAHRGPDGQRLPDTHRLARGILIAANRSECGVCGCLEPWNPQSMGVWNEWHEVSRNRNQQTGIDKSRPPWDKDW
jgi:hypothetical protein